MLSTKLSIVGLDPIIVDIFCKGYASFHINLSTTLELFVIVSAAPIDYVLEN